MSEGRLPLDPFPWLTVQGGRYALLPEQRGEPSEIFWPRKGYCQDQACYDRAQTTKEPPDPTPSV